MPSHAEAIEETEREEYTHGFLLKCHPSACQLNPNGNNKQERMNEVSGREDKRHRADTRGQDNEKRRANLHSNCEHVTEQREGPSGQHLEDFATLPSAVVKVARA